MKFDESLLKPLMACPACRSDLTLPSPGEAARCPGCGEAYRPLPGTWDFIPKMHGEKRAGSNPWLAWKHAQDNSVVAYTADPENNLRITEKPPDAAFVDFCGFHGLVLDVGCGPQPWPAYFGPPSPRATFIGLDPLAGEHPADFMQFRGYGEYMPFRAGMFDAVVFATCLDHFVDPVESLSESRRVCKPDGRVMVWVQEKRPDTPKPETSPEWFLKLKRPPNADDNFHIKHLTFNDLKEFISLARLRVTRISEFRVDEFRTNHFLQAVP